MAHQKQFRSFLDACLEVPETLDSTPKYEKLKPDDISRFKYDLIHSHSTDGGQLHSEAEALTSGAFLEAIVRKGEGNETPQEADLVYFHFTVHPRGDETTVIYSTRPEVENSTGCPLAAMLKKAPRLPRGWEVALSEMRRSERRVLQLKPEFGFQHEDCQYHLPAEFSEEEKKDLSIDIQLIHWYKASEVMSIAALTSCPILKRMMQDGEGYENPRPPYKVQAFICYRKISTDGIQAKGEVLFGSTTQPMEFTMGDESIPLGLSCCLGSMVKNEWSYCIISTKDLQSSQPPFIPLPNELEQIEIEIRLTNVIQVRDLHGDGKVIKQRIVDGKGTFPSDCPLQDCKVEIHYKARPWSDSPSLQESASWIYDSRDNGPDPISADLGCGDLPYGVESCIHLMLPGEVSLAKCRAEVAYNHPSTRCQIPQGLSKQQDIEFEIELIRFEKGMEWAGMSIMEALEEAKKMKNIANELYKQGAVDLASNKYKAIVNQLNGLRDFDSDEQIEEADTLAMTCLSNLASCSIQIGAYPAAVDWCNKALKMNDQNAKVLFRRAKAYSLKGDFEVAEQDLQQVKKLDEKLTTEVEDALLKNRQRKKAAMIKQKQQFQNFFDRS